MDGHTFSPLGLSQKEKQKFAKPMSHVDTTLHNTVCCCWEDTSFIITRCLHSRHRIYGGKESLVEK